MSNDEKKYIKLDIWQLIKNYELKKDNALLHTTSKQKMKKN